MQRYGQVIQLRSEYIEAYEQLHSAVWPEVLAMISACNMRNYTIFRYDTWLFAYFEYVGDDFAVDMARMAADPKTQSWWILTDPMQIPLDDRAMGEWWTTMREVFHSEIQ